MSKLEDFSEGQTVHHAMRGDGVVRMVRDGEVLVEFDDDPGRISGAFDRDWFRVNPNLLRKAP